MSQKLEKMRLIEYIIFATMSAAVIIKNWVAVSMYPASRAI